ncbi:MAG: hypothetical protein V4724_27130 [Pseudomonadota bacterium]
MTANIGDVFVCNFPLSTKLKRSPSKDGNFIFLEDIDFRIHDVQFSDRDEACVSGAYSAEIERELFALENQDIEKNETLMKTVFSKILGNFNSTLWKKTNTENNITLQEDALKNYYILHGPEPFVGFLSYLIRLKNYDFFIGETWPKELPISTHFFLLPSGLYQKHLNEILHNLQHAK